MCEATIHPFEKAGLGKAPFRYVGMEYQDLCYGQRILNRAEYEKTGVMVSTVPGGCCDYCYQYIVNIFLVESADGKRFRVGCDCINKVGMVIKIDQFKKDLKALKKAREDARIAAALTDLPLATALQAQPHPNKFHAAAGKTLADYVAWLFKNGGQAGKLRAARMVEAAMAPKVDE